MNTLKRSFWIFRFSFAPNCKLSSCDLVQGILKKLWDKWEKEKCLVPFLNAWESNTTSTGASASHHQDNLTATSKRNMVIVVQNNLEYVLPPKNELNAALRWACSQLLIKEIRLLLQSSADINAGPIGESSALYLAFFNVKYIGAKHANIFRYLLKNRADVTSIEKELNSSFLECELKRRDFMNHDGKCNIEIIKALVCSGANLSNALYCAALHGQGTAFEYLSKVTNIGSNHSFHLKFWDQVRTEIFQTSHESLNLERAKSKTSNIFQDSARNRNDLALDLQREIDEHRAKPDVKIDEIISESNDTGHTLLHVAAYFGQDQLVKVLLKNNANIEASDYRCRTPLSFAVSEGHMNIVKILVPNYDNMLSGVKSGMCIIESNSSFSVESANLDTLDLNCMTVLDVAIENGQHEIAEYLSSSGASRGCSEVMKTSEDMFSVWYIRCCRELLKFPHPLRFPALLELVFSAIFVVVQLCFCITVQRACAESEVEVRSVSFSRWVDGARCEASDAVMRSRTTGQGYTALNCEVPAIWQIIFQRLCASNCPQNCTAFNFTNTSSNFTSTPLHCVLPLSECCEAGLYIENQAYLSPFNSYDPLQGLVSKLRFDLDSLVQLTCLLLASARVFHQIALFDDFVVLLIHFDTLHSKKNQFAANGFGYFGMSLLYFLRTSTSSWFLLF